MKIRIGLLSLQCILIISMLIYDYDLLVWLDIVLTSYVSWLKKEREDHLKIKIELSLFIFILIYNATKKLFDSKIFPSVMW